MHGAGFDDPSVFRFHPDAVEVALEVGRSDEAEELVVYLEERAQALDQRWTRAVAARCRGLLLSGASQLPQAIEALQRSLDAHGDLAEPFERARTLLALGSTLRRGRQRSRARVVLGEAIGEFDRLGAPLWATRAREEERRIGGRVPSTDLTPAEGSVAQLVAEGLTNREVAARLFVTEHTVETALVRVYAKLGVRSRSELARQMALASSIAGSG
jgi:DNA-binding NarL/FixJ family response regulator